MTNLRYVILRVIRHFMPESVADALKRRGWIIRAGMETTDPQAAVERYLTELMKAGVTISGKRVMVLGYGGRFATGCALLRAGAVHVVLCEYQVKPDDAFNRALVYEYPEFLVLDGEYVLLDPCYITLLNGDIRQLECQPLDLVLSNSVFEHLGDVEGITHAISRLTAPGGVHLHFIDLRDHYFKFPFEMLTFSQTVWDNLLDPTSHLNRWRVWQYRDVFGKYFSQVTLTATETDLAAFERVRHRIRPEFLSGRLEDDSIAQIQVLAIKT